ECPSALYCLPSRRMFSAAFASRSSTSPQRGQTWVRTLVRLLHPLRAGRPIGEHTRTVLAGERRRHGYSLLKSVCCFENKDAQERTPPRIGDTLGEVVVPDHVGRLQIFVVDGVVLVHERQCGLMMEVGALALHLQVCLRKQPYRFLAPIAALLASGDPPLAAPQIRLGTAGAARVVDHRATCHSNRSP